MEQNTYNESMELMERIKEVAAEKYSSSNRTALVLGIIWLIVLVLNLFTLDWPINGDFHKISSVWLYSFVVIASVLGFFFNKFWSSKIMNVKTPREMVRLNDQMTKWGWFLGLAMFVINLPAIYYAFDGDIWVLVLVLLVVLVLCVFIWFCGRYNSFNLDRQNMRRLRELVRQEEEQSL